MNRNVQVCMIIVLLILIAIYLKDAKQVRPSVAYSSPFQNDMDRPNTTIHNNFHVAVTISAPNNFSIKKIEGKQVIVGEKNNAHQIHQEGGEV